MRKRIFKKNNYDVNGRRNVVLVLLALVYSGNPTMGRLFAIEPQLVGLSLILIFFLIKRKRTLLTFDFIIIVGSFAGILLVQCIDFSFYPIVSITGFFVRLFIGYSVFRLVDNFPHVFVRVMVGLALLSFVFYLPYILLHGAGINSEGFITGLAEKLGTIGGGRRPLLFHTFLGGFSVRNSGMFWEPGAFQGYLVLALVFLAFVKHKIPRRQYIRSLQILCVALISTLSTTGYLALVLLPLLHYDWRAQSRKQSVFRILVGVYFVLPILIGCGFYAYKALPFLGEKIHSQLNTLNYREGRWYRGRLGSIVFDWEYIKRRPVTGWGLHTKTRYSLHPWMENSEGMGNGMSDFTAKFGVLGFFVWLIAVYRAFRPLGGGNRLTCFLVCGILLLELQGEVFLGYPFFLGLAFLRQTSIDRGRRSTTRVSTKFKDAPLICSNSTCGYSKYVSFL